TSYRNRGNQAKVLARNVRACTPAAPYTLARGSSSTRRKPYRRTTIPTAPAGTRCIPLTTRYPPDTSRTSRMIRKTAMSVLPPLQSGVDRNDRGSPFVVPSRIPLPLRIAQGGVERRGLVGAPGELRVPGDGLLLVGPPTDQHGEHAKRAGIGQREPGQA